MSNVCKSLYTNLSALTTTDTEQNYEFAILPHLIYWKHKTNNINNLYTNIGFGYYYTKANQVLIIR